MKRTELLLFVSMLFAAVVGAQAATVVVTPSNMNGWAFLNTSPDGIGELASGPAVPPLGTGSARLSTGTHGDERVELRNTAYAGTRLSCLTSLGFSTYATSNNGQQLPYLFVNVDTDGNGTIDDILAFEPPYQTPTSGNPALPNQGSEALDTWQTWDALNGGWWSVYGLAGANPGTGVKPLSDYLALFPDATIANSSTGLGGVRLIFGWASPGDVFDGYVDAFRIGVGCTETVYDFEAESAPVPEPVSVVLGLMGLGSIAGARRFRK